MEIIEKDITIVEFGIIVHQVNCHGVMGSGVAKALRDKWPEIYRSYREDYEEYIYGGDKYNGNNLLGSINVCKIKENLYVVNLFGQQDYRQNHQLSKRFTSYGAWEKALPKLRNYIDDNELPDNVYFPYNIGCDRGGGDWRIISAMIEEYFPNAIICKLPKVFASQTDMMGKACTCGGIYSESSIQDDMHGLLHCSKCNKQIERWKGK